MPKSREAVFSAEHAVFGLPYWFLRILWTVFLFTKSDIKTTLVPITCLAVASAPLTSFSHLFPTMFWIWLQLLQFDVANQTLNPEEDVYNKSHRPIPAKLISMRTAIMLRWILPFACFIWSAAYSKEVLYASIANCALTYAYNDMGYAAGHWAVRNIVNALGFASFEFGACLIAGHDIHSLDTISLLSVLCSTGIFSTTIQAQDFKDRAGDALVGRQTLPLVHPTSARPTLLVAIAIWSVLLSTIWGLNAFLALLFNLLGAFVGARFLLKTSIKADQRSFYIYNLWLSVAHSLPAYFRSSAASHLYVMQAME